jgi:hypothetical protein
MEILYSRFSSLGIIQAQYHHDACRRTMMADAEPILATESSIGSASNGSQSQKYQYAIYVLCSHKSSIQLKMLCCLMTQVGHHSLPQSRNSRSTEFTLRLATKRVIHIRNFLKPCKSRIALQGRAVSAGQSVQLSVLHRER